MSVISTGDHDIPASVGSCKPQSGVVDFATGLEEPLLTLARNAGVDPDAVLEDVGAGGVFDARSRLVEAEDTTTLYEPAEFGIQAIAIAAGLAADFLVTGSWSPKRDQD